MQEIDSSKIKNLVDRVNKNRTGIFKRESELIVTLPPLIANVIKSNRVYLSEFVIAKVKGRIRDFSGHPNITDTILSRIPINLSKPFKIIEDTRHTNKKEYLFINIEPIHQIVVEIERKSTGLTEINTIFDSTENELKRLEGKLPTIFSSGETPISRIHAST